MPVRTPAKVPDFSPTQKRELVEMAADPAVFREKALIVPTANGPPALLGAVAAPFQRARFAAIDSALLAVSKGEKPPIGRYWWEATKGASKDSDLAVCLLWLLAFSRRQLRCQVGAADQDQADELRKAAKAILKENAWLGKLVTIQNWTISNPLTEATVEIIPADTLGSHGARPDVLIINELSCIGKRDFVDNLLDNAAKVPNGLVVIATNAGTIDTWQWEYREEARTSAAWSFHQFTEPSPWIDRAVLAERERVTAPRRFRRLWWGEWSDGEGDALSRDCILAAVNPKLGPMRGDEPGWVFIGGLDLAVSRDHSAFVVIGKHVGHVEEMPRAETERPARPSAFDVLEELGITDDDGEPFVSATDHPACDYRETPGTGRIRLASCLSWRAPPGGKISLIDVQAAIARAHQRFHFARCGYDPSQAELMAQQLTNEGVPMHVVTQQGANLATMAGEILERFNSREIDLYDNPADDSGQLIDDLRRLQIVERSYGLKLEGTRSSDRGHVDRAVALAIGLLVARSVYAGGQAHTQINGRLVCWPE
jgi:hypothetical protein